MAPNAQIHVWRAFLDRLPFKSNLVRRGVNLSQISCPMCNKFDEIVNHLFITYEVSQKIWDRCDIWVGNSSARHHFVVNHFQSFHVMNFNKKSSVVWKGVWIAIVWEIWKQRDEVVFNNALVDGVEIFSLAQLKGWQWAKLKNFGISFSLLDWLMFPEQCLKK